MIFMRYFVELLRSLYCLSKLMGDMFFDGTYYFLFNVGEYFSKLKLMGDKSCVRVIRIDTGYGR